MQTFEGVVLTLHRRIGVGAVTQLIRQAVEVEACEQVVDCISAHLGNELVGIGVFKILVLLRQLAHELNILVLVEEVVGRYAFLSQHAGLDDNVALVIDDGIELLGRQAQKITDLVGQGAEIPDVGDRDDQLDMAGTLTTHLLFCHFDTASVADDAFVTDTLVLAAVALIVFCRAENALAEKTVTLGLIGAIVDCLGLQHLTIRIFQDFLGRGQSDGNLREIALYLVFSLKCHIE